ncbi:MAG TPA: twin-arginine translocase TatA/TatE family subunit [Caldithrix abyssi]|uniref:Sec-independent protein translocase protein TatA n=1 Tax=Caldithrix abyssi TaxID=187145 RepID=A0A7V5RQ99_CALAY|nr:twin-arginine translocase TatA/TatE family subunit [Caldithrix abyssi]
MFGIGTTELIVILFIILLVFGSKKLPELARGLGRGINEFKRASQEIQEELDVSGSLKETPEKKASSKTETKDSSKGE